MTKKTRPIGYRLYGKRLKAVMANIGTHGCQEKTRRVKDRNKNEKGT